MPPGRQAPWQPGAGGHPGTGAQNGPPGWQPPGGAHPPNPWAPAPGSPLPGRKPWRPRQSGKDAGQSSSYRGLGAFGDVGVTPKRSRKPWIIAAAIVVVLAGGGVGAWQLGAFRGDVLDRKSVEDGVQKVLREDFGEGDLRDASCPANRPIKTGTTFECTVTVAGQPKKVTVRVLNEQAQFEVGAPK